MKVWQILVVVAAGIGYSWLAPGQFTYAFGHATLYVFLPALLFEAAWNLNYRSIVRQWPAIATLAGPGVILTALIVAGALAVVRVPLGPAFLAGAILSATDPIAVVAVFRRLRVPKTLATIVECESLFNDAVAVVLYRGVLAALALTTPAAGAIAAVVLWALAGALGGVAVGVALAFAIAALLRGSRKPELQIAVTLVCAYGVYFVCDRLQLSGIFAVVAFGIALRHFERTWITLRLAADVYQFWDILALASNVLVFFLVGAALQIGSVAREPAFVIAALAAIAVARVAVAGLLLPGGYPRSWLDVVRIAGMRGALSLALALALPANVPYRQAIVDATFAVALATLLATALSAKPVVERATRGLFRG
ncbi:MAG TPA: cation:proton antiporter [Candidatus Acidoferrales bacterium]|nr:cation:proton antiporter [Candidatus Acidoferrales bacterium]